MSERILKGILKGVRYYPPTSRVDLGRTINIPGKLRFEVDKFEMVSGTEKPSGVETATVLSLWQMTDTICLTEKARYESFVGKPLYFLERPNAKNNNYWNCMKVGQSVDELKPPQGGRMGYNKLLHDVNKKLDEILMKLDKKEG